MCLSILIIRLFDVDSCNFDMTSFSTPITTPSFPLIAIAVLWTRSHAHNHEHVEFHAESSTSSPAVIYRLLSVLHLENSTVWWKLRRWQVVLQSRHDLCKLTPDRGPDTNRVNRPLVIMQLPLFQLNSSSEMWNHNKFDASSFTVSKRSEHAHSVVNASSACPSTELIGCCVMLQSLFQWLWLKLYQYELATGLYMLTRKEKIILSKMFVILYIYSLRRVWNMTFFQILFLSL